MLLDFEKQKLINIIERENIIKNLEKFDKKKQRGQKRKLKALLNHIDNFILFEGTDDRYEHFHVPCDQSFINSPKTSGKVKIVFFKNG